MKTFPVSSILITLTRIVVAIGLTFLTVIAFAQDKSESPYFFVLSDNPTVDQLPLRKTEASVRIAGVIADVTVTQEYKNTGTRPIEAVYTFPASVNAAVYGMEMRIGDRVIRAKIDEKKKAREDYERAKTEGKRASLLEQHRPNVFTMQVANVMPDDVIEVTLRYTEMLIPEEGIYSFVYPTVVGPRYSGEGSATTPVSFVSNPHTRQSLPPVYAFDLALSLSAGLPVQHVASPTHAINARFETPDRVNVKLDEANSDGGNRDFVLQYRLAGGEIQSGVMLYEHNDEHFFMVMIQPPARVVKEQIPPREYVFIVDVSGSMHGFPIQTAKTLLNNLIVNLNPDDRFNVLVFESGAHWLADESLPANHNNVLRAFQFLDRQQGGGGTRLLHAMNKAMSLPRHTDGLSRSFVVITDGYVQVEREVFEMIRTQSNAANVFAFGIGSSVNRYIIDGIAHVGQSEPFVVLNPASADAEATRFRKYINNPVLTGIKTSYQGFQAYDVEPASLPDLMAERPLILFGKYKGKPQGTITVEGRAGDKKYKQVFRLDGQRADEKHSALRYLWARRKIQQLDDYRYIGSSDDAITREITALGLKYSLLTNYTSFVAIDEVITNRDQGLTSVKQPLPMPAGVEDSAIGFDLDDEEEENVSFHRIIKLPADFDNTTQNKLKAAIERKMLQHVNRYIAERGIYMERIEVIVGIDGGIVKASFTGKNLTETHRRDLMQLILAQDFRRFQLLRAWTFTVVF